MDRKVLYINSQDRDVGGSDEDFTITKVIQEFPIEPKSVKLISASIPYTWDNITADNNDFSVDEDTVGTEAFTIPPGNYSGTQLASTIQSMLNTGATLTQTYVVTFSTQTLLFTFTTTGPNGFQLIFPLSGSAAALLGFNPGTTYPGVPALTFTSINKAVLVDDYEIFICSDLVRGSDNGVIPWNTSAAPAANSQYQILARVPISSCFGGIINYTASIDLPFFITTQSQFGKVKAIGDATTVRFFLSFPSGNTVDLNGYHWTCEIILDFNRSS